MREEILFRMNLLIVSLLKLSPTISEEPGKLFVWIGNLRGNEIQQMYTAAALVKRLKKN